MTSEGEQDAGAGWREILLQRLLVVVAPVIGAAMLVGVAGSHGEARSSIALLLPFVPLLMVAAYARRWPFKLRAGILIAPLGLAVFIVYVRLGFRANASLIGAATVVLTGLFFGRRGAIAAVGVLALAPITAGTAMVNGVLAIRELRDMALDNPVAWVRTTFVSLAVWTTLGVAVTFVVERIETALAKTRETLISLRTEQAKREEAEQARRDAQESALQAQKMEIVGRLASGTAHDFNNLLGVVGNWAELLLLDAPPTPVVDEARQAVETAMKQGRSLTRQLMRLGRRQERSVSRVCLEQCAKAGVATLSRVLPAGVQLSFEELEPAAVEADETELHQVLFNLVLNARDAMPLGGTIRVSTGVEATLAPQTVVGGTLAPGRWAVLRVADSGPGIEPELADKIFDLFFTTKPAGLGTGLGLATVQRIAESNGGGVALSTGDAGRGATFSVYLPCVASLPE